MTMRTLLGATAAAVAAMTAFPAPASAGAAQCVLWAVGETNVGGEFTLIPPSVSPEVSHPDPAFQSRCLLLTVGGCTAGYDPLGSGGVAPRTVGYVECLVLPD